MYYSVVIVMYFSLCAKRFRPSPLTGAALLYVDSAGVGLMLYSTEKLKKGNNSLCSIYWPNKWATVMLLGKIFIIC